MSTSKSRRCAEYRNALIVLGLLNGDRTLRYIAKVPSTRWGEAIQRLLSDRGWTQKQLAEEAELRPNTVTNLIKHGKHSDTETLSRIAAALGVDVSELFITREQSQILGAYRENRIERLKEAVLKEMSTTVTRLIREEFEKVGEPPGPPARGSKARRTRRRRTDKH